MKKIILFILNYSSPDNIEVNEPVKEGLIENIEELAEEQEDIICDTVEITTSKELYTLFHKKLEKIKEYTSGDFELYLHFSGHGKTKGHFYGEDLMSNNKIDDILRNEYIKFIFFSNCFSERLAKKVIRHSNINLCIASAQELGVYFSIAFENLFYKKLLEEKTSFLNAFKSTSSELSPNHKNLIEYDQQGAAKYMLHKGGGAGSAEAKPFNKLNCIWNEAATANKIKGKFRLRHKSFSEQVLEAAEEKFLQQNKQILIVYNTDTVDRYLEFLKFIRKENWASVNHIITINDPIVKNKFDKELKKIVKELSTPEFIAHDDLIKIKFLQLTSEEIADTEWLHNSTFKNHLINDSNNYQYFDLLVVSSNRFFNISNQKNFEAKHFARFEESFKANKKLEKILSVSSIPLNKRIVSTHKIPCGTASDKMEDYKKDETPLQPLEVVIAEQLEPELYNFLINGLKFYLSSQYPVILYEGDISSSILHDMSVGFKKFFGTDSVDSIEEYISDLIRNTQKYNLRFFSINLYGRTEEEIYYEDIKKIMTHFNTSISKKIAQYAGDTKFLFINTNTTLLKEKIKKLATDFDHIAIKELPAVSEKLDKTKLDSWIDKHFGSTKSEKDHIKKILKFSTLIDQSPKFVIQNNCSSFSLPEEKFFNLT